MFARIDRWVIESGFEPLAHWIDRSFGITNFTIARFGIVVWAAGAATHAHQTGSALWWSLAAMIVLLAPLTIMVIYYDEKKTKPGLANAEKLKTISIFFRWVLTIHAGVLLLLALYAGFGPSDFSFLAYWLHLYFRACDTPKPWAEHSLAYAGRT